MMPRWLDWLLALPLRAVNVVLDNMNGALRRLAERLDR